MYCSKCGKKLPDDAVFCDACGTKVGGAEKKEIQRKEGKVYKCPSCGEVLPFDALKCPSCGQEIRGREVTDSVQSFFEKINKVDNDEKKIELIKTYPIPNNREDILEFMFLSTSNFDAKYYATNKNKDSLASAWRSKIEQCYQKGKIMLTSQSDLEQLEHLYNKARSQTKAVVKHKLILIAAGFVGVVGGLVIIVALGKDNTAVGAVGIGLLVAGIVALVFGFKRKKTNKELEAEKLKKEQKKNKNAQPQIEKEVEKHVIHETVVKHEYVEPKQEQVREHNDKEIESAKAASPLVEEEKPTPIVDDVKEEATPKKEVSHPDQNEQSGSISYPKGEIETLSKVVLRPNEKVIMKQNVTSINGDEDYYYKVVLTNQALNYVRDDEGEEEEDAVTRIPLGNIIQVLYQKGDLFNQGTIEVYREGETDVIEGNKKIALLALAINDRFDSATVNRDQKYYENVNLKDIK